MVNTRRCARCGEVQDETALYCWVCYTKFEPTTVSPGEEGAVPRPPAPGNPLSFWSALFLNLAGTSFILIVSAWLFFGILRLRSYGAFLLPTVVTVFLYEVFREATGQGPLFTKFLRKTSPPAPGIGAPNLNNYPLLKFLLITLLVIVLAPVVFYISLLMICGVFFSVGKIF